MTRSWVRSPVPAPVLTSGVFRVYAGIVNLKWTRDRLGKLRHLYNSGLSMRESGEKLGVSVWAVNAAMRRHGITRRKVSETRKIQFLKSPLSYHKKEKLSSAEKSLLLAALMLYWAEGAKTFGGGKVDFANSDESMVKIFLSCLRQIYQVNEKRIRVSLYCYSNQNVQSLVEYWTNILHLPKKQFFRPYVRSDYDPKKVNKMTRGLVHIVYSDIRLLKQILEEIGKIACSLKLGYSSGNEGGL